MTVAETRQPAKVSDWPVAGDLRAEHFKLMRKCQKLAPYHQLVIADAFRLRAAKAGAWIRSPAEQNIVQGMIDYWTARIATIPDKKTYPHLVELTDFDENMESQAGNVWASHAQAAFDSLPASKQEDAWAIVCVVAAAEDRNGTVSLTLKQINDRLGKNAHVGLMKALVGADILRRTVAGKGGEDRFELASGLLARYWPLLKTWLERPPSETDILGQQEGLAKRWLESDRDKGYLLSGKALETAREVLARHSQNAHLEEFVKASNAAETAHQRSKSQTRNIAAVSIFATLTVLIAGGRWYIDNSASDAVTQTNNEVASSAAVDGDIPVVGAPVTLQQGKLSQRDAQKIVAEIESAQTSENATAADADSISGSMWIGATGNSVLVDVTTGRFVDPATVKPNQIYKLYYNVWLRTASPASATNYASATPIALINQGSLVYAKDGPVPYDRPSGRQYWLKVSVVPMAIEDHLPPVKTPGVYVQYPPGDSREISALVAELRKAFPKTKGQQLLQARGLREVRYFNKGQRAAAQDLAKKATAILRQSDPNAPELLVKDFSPIYKSGENAFLEIWIDPVSVDKTE
ncbi:hypothetical protein OVA03_07920 [Asticcacaulis sp. SL142]|uniref:hypothetical protein n=1 Tax=Asticcacaulis sp. SL142 TaxID=2995155 RepID=UPI00226CCD9F|nr:hypothetical protein [Asticcacaulis sp. SL142]WAC49813.1 hypothetical protein OVA03_07920 [Asticcacaulis sp. SL142]